jgi:predicted GTPase
MGIEEQYEGDRLRRSELSQYIDQVKQALLVLEMDAEQDSMARLKTVVESETFKVLVLGEFNAGKSTFINALLGKEILPSYAKPATAIINEIKWAEEPSALLHFREPEKDPQPVEASQLEKYVVIQDTLDEIVENPYSYIELFWPIDLCKNHVEIIDSPGLNESAVREKVTLDYLNKVDAVVFVMSALRLGPSINEQETIKTLSKSGHEELFFVVNQFDLLRRQKDRDDVVQRANEKFSAHGRRREKAIHFISALDALIGREGNQQDLVETSGILGLEQELNNFLANDRSRTKSKRAAMELQLSVVRAQKMIPDKRQYLTTPLSELRSRYQESQVLFEKLSSGKDEMVRKVTGFRRDTNILITGKIQDFFRDIERDIDGWVDEYEIKPKASLNIKRQVTDTVEAICASLGLKLEARFEAWQEDVLSVFLGERLSVLKRDLSRLAEEFEADLRQTRIELLGTQLATENLTVGQAGPKNALERVLAAAGGFFLMGPTGAGLGAVLGWKEMAKAFLPQLLVYMTAGTIGFPLLPALVIAGLVQGGLAAFNIFQKLKDEVKKEYKNKLREVTGDQAKKVTEQLELEFEKLGTQIERGVQLQIDEVRDQVEFALRSKEEGEQSVNRQLKEIDLVEADLQDVNVALVNFVASLD